MEKQKDLFGQMVQENFKIESLSDDFTDQVVSKIHSTPLIDPSLRKPLISKKVWLVISSFYFFCFISVFVVNTKIDVWSFLNYLPFEETSVHTIKKNFILSTQIGFVITIIYLGDYLLSSKKLSWA